MWISDDSKNGKIVEVRWESSPPFTGVVLSGTVLNDEKKTRMYLVRDSTGELYLVDEAKLTELPKEEK